MELNNNNLAAEIEENVPLAPFTTMRVGGPARYFYRVKQQKVIPQIIKWAESKNIPIVIIGGGSNMIVSSNGFNGLVLKIEIYGISPSNETSDKIELTVGAGENWDSFVEFAVQRGYWGVENLSLIPGTVGAAPVQNISAYGQEVKDVIKSVRAFDMKSYKYVEFSNKECDFGFRRSIFNTREFGRYIILSVVFYLSKARSPCLTRRQVVNSIIEQRRLNCHADKFDQKLLHCIKFSDNKSNYYELYEIRDAIIRLRSSGKLLPQPNTIGNSGTFFRAGLIQQKQFGFILRTVFFNLGLLLALKIIGCKLKYSSEKGFKIPSRLLIKACDLVHIKYGNFSLYQNNCAVLVHSGDQSNTEDIIKLIKKVRSLVYNKTGVIPPIEPSLVGFTEEELNQIFYLDCSKV